MDIVSVSKDGQWLVVKKWSECSKSCGGGVSVLQRMCLPPKAGGRPCYGPNKIAKACNTQPCQVKPEDGIPILNLPDTTASTEILMKPVSKRHNRYEECVLREGDLAQVREELASQFPEAPRIPVRVVLNNKTFIVYDNDN